ncbi:SLAP domain-containing protein [Streptomyces sp. NBC_01167]|uniref:hypothetical protein n=1 Tax=Streptomyces sp. NBC_01167 TaxID=2903756 RepID=UPI0038675FDF|nr:SLAP domain-containing protein [Streptomyces sp. NBC_01167]
MKRQRGTGRVTFAAMAAMCVVAGLPAQALAAGEPNPYVFDSEAKTVKGSAVNSDGPALAAGSVYKDAIKPGEKRYYRVDLDARTNAYISAVAVPRLKTKVASLDKLSVSIEDRSGTKCGSGDAQFGSAAYARPVAAYADRMIDKDSSSCQEAGAYYVLIERDGDAASSPEPWDVEIRFAAEPGLKAAGPTAAPENWPSASPPPPAGSPQKRAGGTSFSDATGLTEGEWRDEILPGRTRFYRVPLDWGQQIFASADLGTSPTASDTTQSVSSALSVSLHNPARGLVDETASVYYDGKQKSVALDPVPPVAYENRFDSTESTSAMRFAGWYYIAVTLSPEVGAEYGSTALSLTLRVNVKGKPKAAPAYDGAAGDFQVTEDDQAAADSGKSGSDEDGSDPLQLVAAVLIGTGTVLLLGLGVWLLLKRRRASAAPTGPGAGTPAVPGQGPATLPDQGHVPGGHGQGGQVPGGHAQGDYGQGGQVPGQAPGAQQGQFGPPPSW